MYAHLPENQEVNLTDDVDTDLQRYMAGERLEVETRGPKDDVVVEVMRSEVPDFQPYFGSEVKVR
jgi:NOL1/NOP2/fmu family ribosome biogenesis protein